MFKKGQYILPTKMKKQHLALVLLSLQILIPYSTEVYGSPVAEAEAEAEADPSIYLNFNIQQFVGGEGGSSADEVAAFGAHAFNGADEEEKDTEVPHTMDIEPDAPTTIELEEPTTIEPKSCDNWFYPSTDWSTTCPNYCDGALQSPIEAFPQAVSSLYRPGLLVHTNFDQVTRLNINNNGNTVRVSVVDTGAPAPTISGGRLDGTYTLDYIEFHWGCERQQHKEITEHSYPGDINGTYSLEIHAIHYKTEYGSIEEAMKHDNGLAVTGSFLQAYHWPDHPKADFLKPVTDNLHHIVEAGMDIEIDYNDNLEAIVVPLGTPVFWRYKGSLTTPPCAPAIWSFYSAPVGDKPLSLEQMEAFRLLKNRAGAPLCDNFREVQPTNDREITYGIPG